MLHIVDRLSPNHDERGGAPVELLVLHYTGMPTAAEAVARLCDPAAKVSAHYVIDEDGAVLRLVPEELRAWHAGVSSWRGRCDVNARSIGIEIVNPGHEFGYHPFPEPQMAALVELCRTVTGRWGIAAGDVVGHSDVAPRRKCDPGELFDWRRLAAAGIGHWPAAVAAESGMAADTARSLLEGIGYETDDLAASLTAFQRRFRPSVIDGRLDAETAGRLRAVCQLGA